MTGGSPLPYVWVGASEKKSMADCKFRESNRDECIQTGLKRKIQCTTSLEWSLQLRGGDCCAKLQENRLVKTVEVDILYLHGLNAPKL